MTQQRSPPWSLVSWTGRWTPPLVGEMWFFSRLCTGGKGYALIPAVMVDEFDPGVFPTLDDARNMAIGQIEKDDSKVA